jgi:hypothetical protein
LLGFIENADKFILQGTFVFLDLEEFGLRTTKFESSPAASLWRLGPRADQDPKLATKLRTSTIQGFWGSRLLLPATALRVSTLIDAKIKVEVNYGF